MPGFICRRALTAIFFLQPLVAAAAVTEGSPIAFRNVAVFDGQRLVPDQTVIVSEGLIRTIGKDAGVPAGAIVIDGAARTLLPGLIDCHTHTFSREMLQQAAVFGVTTELDMFTDHSFAAAMRSEQVTGKANDRADLRSAGTLVTAPGGHGTQFGLKIPTLTQLEEADAFVAARVAEGSDYIKIVCENGGALGMRFPSLDRATIAGVIRAAHARKKLAVVHVSALNCARDVVEEGADGLVHLFLDEKIDESLLGKMRTGKTFVIPTLTVLESCAGIPSGQGLVDDPDLKSFLGPADVENLKRSFPHPDTSPADYSVATDAVKKLKTAGVPILAGTDAPNPGTTHGASIHRELELLVAAGLTPAEALAAATSIPAARFGLDDRGRIAPGLRADLLLVEGDPTQDIRRTRKIVGVWKGGVAIEREAARAAIAAATQAAAQSGQAPPPPGSESALISDFEGERPAVAYGAGWAPSTDAMVGGKSTAEFKVVPGGAGGSRGALAVTGTVEDRQGPHWGGAMFFPGSQPMAAANLSAKEQLSFWAKGDGKSYSVMVFFKRNGFAPSEKRFTAGPEWQEVSFKLADFNGCDGSDVMGIFIGSSVAAGEYRLLLDDVKLE